MANRPLECSRIDLESLLTENSALADQRPVLAHLETCPECQRRLETLAAADDWWQDCQTHLGLSEANGHEPSSAQVSQQTDTAWLPSDFPGVLAPPSHPEMLGRIGRYEVERLLGRGGMGVVFKAFDTELNRPIAIKVLAPHLAGSGAARQRFGREARATAAVVHEHVVSIHDVEASANPPFLVMQYVPGESLQAYVERQGPLHSGDVVRIGHQIAAGLAAAHAQGLVHRDIKPGNIMLENGLSRVVITDFGLARAADDASLTHSGIVAGTPHYMSPEQARGETADARSDLFSLGAVLYFMATGHPPFRAEQAMAVLHRICHDRHRPLYQIDPNIPDELDGVIGRLLEKKSSRRFNSASEVQHVLAGLLNQTQRSRRWLSRFLHKRWLLCSSAVMLVLVAVGFSLLSGWQYSSGLALDKAGGTSPTEIASADATGAEAEAVDSVAGQPNFAGEVMAIEQSLREITGRRFPEAAALEPGGDSWRRDFGAAFEEIERLEKSWPAGYDSPAPLKSSSGEMP